MNAMPRRWHSPKSCSVEVRQDRFGPRLGRVLLELLELRVALALRHGEERVDRGAELRGDALLDAPPGHFLHARHASVHKPLQRGASGELDLPRTQSRSCKLQGARKNAVAGAIGEPAPETFLGMVVEGLVVKVNADPLGVPRVRCCPLGRHHEERRREPELAAHVVCDAHRDRGEVVHEAPEGAKRAQMDREAMPIGVAATATDLNPIVCGERPVARELLVGGVGRKLRVRHGHGCLANGGS
jgi:hypothetical protein